MADSEGNVLDFNGESEKLLNDAKSKYNTLHNKIYGEISSMLSKAKVMLMPELKSENPTFISLVEYLKDYRKPLEALAPMIGGIDENITLVDHHIQLAENLADAIDSGSHDSLCAAIAALDDEPYI